ncbi:MAG: outer membrane protein [Devosiaceae bacterium]
MESRWTGVYVGAHIGHGWLDTYDDLVGAKENTESFLGGGFAGYSYQSGNLVLGAEVDFSLSAFERQRILNVEVGLVTDYLSSARARVGGAFGDFHLYATGGLFVGHVRLESSITNIISDTHQFGYIYGAGAEYALNPDWTVGVEAVRHELFADDYVLATTFEATGNIDVVRARFSYQF